MGTLVHPDITYAWKKIQEQLSTIISSSQEQATYWANWMVFIVAFWTWPYMCSAKIQQAKSDQCIKGVLGTPKLTNNSCMVSYCTTLGDHEKGHSWNNVFICTILWLPSPMGVVIYAKIKWGPLCAYNLMFFICAQSLAMYSHPFFTPSLGRSWWTILQPWCLIKVSHLHPTILSLPSINKQTLHLIVWMKPPSNTMSFAQDSFATHSI